MPPTAVPVAPMISPCIMKIRMIRADEVPIVFRMRDVPALLHDEQDRATR